MDSVIHETDEFRFIGNPYRIAVSKFAMDAEYIKIFFKIILKNSIK